MSNGVIDSLHTHSEFLIARMVLSGYLPDLENLSVMKKLVCYEVLPFIFEKKLDKDRSLVFIVSPLVSVMVDQVRSLCVSEGPRLSSCLPL